MGRRLLLGVALLAGIVTPGAWLEAAPRKAAVETKFTLGWVGDEPTLRVEGRGVKFFKRVGRDKVAIRVEVPGDVVELEAEMNGAVRIGRQGRFLRLQMKDHFEASIAKVQKLTVGSRALDGLEGLVASLQADGRQEARSVMTSYALLHAVRGSAGPIAAVAATVKAAATGRSVRAASTAREETPFACWAEYAVNMVDYVVEFNSCVDSYWWIPGWPAVCAFQFTVQAELAWFWVLSCSGGMPV
ncbi:MAG: hypothetical protein WC815_01735 [Vicinamibacterales bacterium]|jgi:hypothetical protein